MSVHYPLISGLRASRRGVSIGLLALFAVTSFFHTVYAQELSLENLDGSNGFRFEGSSELAKFGSSVSNIGDINGDGFDDVVVGAEAYRSGGVLTGAAYVLFGTSQGFPARLRTTDIDGIRGFAIEGVIADHQLGASSASAGDLNGDGLDDLVIVAPLALVADRSRIADTAYIIYGRAGSFPARFDLTSLDGTNGFSVVGAQVRVAAAAGDINNDGVGDLVLGGSRDINQRGSAYVIYGTQQPAGPQINLTNLNGNNGFRIVDLSQDKSITSVAPMGDVNGDGIDDFAVGAAFADARGRNEVGRIHVIFGRSGSFGRVFD